MTHCLTVPDSKRDRARGLEEMMAALTAEAG